MVGYTRLGVRVENKKPLGQLERLAQLVNKLDTGVFKNAVAGLFGAEAVFVVHGINEKGLCKAAQSFPSRQVEECAGLQKE